MILTVTMNPSIDTAYPLAGPLKVDDVNRVEPIKTAGGKPLKVGLAAGVIKYSLALLVVMLFVSKEANF